jgi:hypothetical protein
MFYNFCILNKNGQYDRDLGDMEQKKQLREAAEETIYEKKSKRELES